LDKADRGITGDYDTYIARALATEGGHLSIGRGGFSLYFARGAHLSEYDCKPVKAACIAAGLPVIDSRVVDCRGRPACNQGADDRGRRAAVASAHHSLSYAPLSVVTAAYRAAGAEVWNLDRAR
jgi:hypothetical protein